MMFKIWIISLAIAPLALGIEIKSSSLMARSTTLANGTSMTYGSTSNGLNWQASGVLKQGCSSTPKYPITINDCYTLSLTSDPTKQLDPGFPNDPRQRIEFLTKGASDGSSFTYKWKYYLSSQTGTTSHFFHLMQIFTRGGSGGPVITLDAVSGKVAIKDYVRNCADTKCPSIALNKFTDITTQHTMKITYGPNGKLNYVITNAATGATLMSYVVSGSMGSDSTSLKFGTYRDAVSGMTISLASLGDFTSS